MSVNNPVPGVGGEHYVPFEERTGESSVVFFTRDLSEEGLKKIYDRVGQVLAGRVAVKLHTGEMYGPNIIPRLWVKELLKDRSPRQPSSRPTPTTRAPATPPRTISRHSRSTAGPSARWTSPTARA